MELQRIGHDWATELDWLGYISYIIKIIATFLVAQMIKNLSAMEEIWVQSLGQDDSLEKARVTHSGILA